MNVTTLAPNPVFVTSTLVNVPARRMWLDVGATGVHLASMDLELMDACLAIATTLVLLIHFAERLMANVTVLKMLMEGNAMSASLVTGTSPIAKCVSAMVMLLLVMLLLENVLLVESQPLDSIVKFALMVTMVIPAWRSTFLAKNALVQTQKHLVTPSLTGVIWTLRTMNQSANVNLNMLDPDAQSVLITILATLKSLEDPVCLAIAVTTGTMKTLAIAIPTLESA